MHLRFSLSTSLVAGHLQFGKVILRQTVGGQKVSLDFFLLQNYECFNNNIRKIGGQEFYKPYAGNNHGVRSVVEKIYLYSQIRYNSVIK